MARVDGTKTIEFRFLPSRLMGGTGEAHWLCRAHTQEWAADARTSDTASKRSVLLLCFYCAFICVGRVVRAEEERGRNGTEASRGEERIGKERNRDCPSVSRWYISCLFVLFLSFFFKMRYYHWHFHQTQLAGMISLLVSILFYLVAPARVLYL